MAWIINYIPYIWFGCNHSSIPQIQCWLNTLRLRQDGHHFPGDIFIWIFLNEIIWIAIKISLKFVPRGLINNIPALVQIMALRQPGDKPLSEPMMVSLLTHLCVTRPQWVNQSLSVKEAPVIYWDFFSGYHRLRTLQYNPAWFLLSSCKWFLFHQISWKVIYNSATTVFEILLPCGVVGA